LIKGSIHEVLRTYDLTEEVNAMSKVLKGLGVDLTDENFKDTPKRIVDHFFNFTKPQKVIEEDVKEFMKARFPTTSSDMVVIENIEASSLCPHHFIPVLYNIDAGYIPKKYVVGLSKIPRLAVELAKHPFLQETYTDTLADLLFKGLESLGAIVVVRGLHTCMTARGIKQKATTITSSVRGVFFDEPHAKTEFLELIKTNKGGWL
jgi:GTP cyclohydrolase IA